MSKATFRKSSQLKQSDTDHATLKSPVGNPSNFSPTSNGISTNSRDSRQQNDYLVPSLNSSVIQDLGFQWANGNFTTTQSTSHDLHLARKGDLPEDHYPKFTEMIHSNTTSSSSIEDFHLQQQATMRSSCSETFQGVRSMGFNFQPENSTPVVAVELL
ncbi:hypothetical protein CsSME_00013634 [Camellia sinensis var. sinensis]